MHTLRVYAQGPARRVAVGLAGATGFLRGVSGAESGVFDPVVLSLVTRLNFVLLHTSGCWCSWETLVCLLPSRESHLVSKTCHSCASRGC